jgi:hypothetical protein
MVLGTLQKRASRLLGEIDRLISNGKKGDSEEVEHVLTEVAKFNDPMMDLAAMEATCPPVRSLGLTSEESPSVGFF